MEKYKLKMNAWSPALLNPILQNTIKIGTLFNQASLVFFSDLDKIKYQVLKKDNIKQIPLDVITIRMFSIRPKPTSLILVIP